MGRSRSALTPDDIARLPEQCAGCLRWERFVDGARLPRERAGDDVTALKRQWWLQTLASGAGGGVVVRAASGNGARGNGAGGNGAGGNGAGAVAGAVAGYATYTLPRRPGDALTVLGLHVDPICRGVGLGRVLVQAVAREALRRPRIRAVEALAGAGLPAGAASRCLVPLDFWLACGFTVVRRHPLTPTVRLDARMLVALRTEVEEAVEQAWERLRGAVRPDPAPRPALRR